MPFHFPVSGSRTTLFGRAVSGRRFRVQHLQRIAAAVVGARNHSLDILPAESAAAALVFWRRVFPRSARSKSVRRGHGAQAPTSINNPKRQILFHIVFLSSRSRKFLPVTSPPAHNCQDKWIIWKRPKRVLDIEILELQRLRERLGENFSRAVELIKEAVDARGKVVVVGVGKSGHIGSKIASTLTSTGSPAVVLDSLNALHGDLGMVADGDVVLALSASGETEELLRVLPAIARFQVKIIAVCGDPKSTLAQNAHVLLDVNIEQEACPLNLAPTSSTTVMLALGDALAMVLLEARGFNKEDFAKFHPGGMIGRSLLMRVHQIMRPREAMAVVSPNTSDPRSAQGDDQRPGRRRGRGRRRSTITRHFHARRFRTAFPVRLEKSANGL